MEGEGGIGRVGLEGEGGIEGLIGRIRGGGEEVGEVEGKEKEVLLVRNEQRWRKFHGRGDL